LKEKHGLQVVITGVESDRAFAGMDQILSASGEACVSLIGKLSLLGTAAVIQKAKLLCSVDSSPIHMAEALHTPVVALFGPMNPYVWMPRHTPSRIIHPTVAHNEFSPETPSAKMSDISVEYVLRNISEILAG
ncbi:MAG: glycosyltransferase family 9 protein, partial [Chthoniobacterales bacterium]